MANWCMNRVEFNADETQMMVLEDFFHQLATRELETDSGQLPDFALEERGYLFNIEFEHGMLYYQTKWAPNTGAVIAIAKHFSVVFKYNYEEYGMQIFGEAVYENGELSMIELDNFDLDTFEFMTATETYLFEGAHYELIDEIIETLISRKRINACNSNQ